MIMETFAKLNPILQALAGTAFTYAMTALGAAGVFLSRDINRKWLDAMMGFAAGVMIAASYFSLLAPAIDLSGSMGVPLWFPAVAGFLAGGAFLLGMARDRAGAGEWRRHRR